MYGAKNQEGGVCERKLQYGNTWYEWKNTMKVRKPDYKCL